MNNEEEEIITIEANEGTRRLDFWVYVIEFLTGIPVESRPWNIKQQITIENRKVADQIILYFTNMIDFPDLEIPKVSTVLVKMEKFKTVSVEVATKYEKKIEALIAARVVDPNRDQYTLLVDNEGTVLELDSEIFNMKAAGMTNLQIDAVKRTGSEERAVTAANLRLSRAILILGQTELIDYEKTTMGRKEMASQEVLLKKAAKDAEQTNAEQWARQPRQPRKNKADGEANETKLTKKQKLEEAQIELAKQKKQESNHYASCQEQMLKLITPEAIKKQNEDFAKTNAIAVGNAVANALAQVFHPSSSSSSSSSSSCTDLQCANCGRSRPLRFQNCPFCT